MKAQRRLSDRATVARLRWCGGRVGIALLACLWAGRTPAVTVPTWPLNDTGIDWCANGNTNNLACPVAGWPWQDAQDGRDAHQDNDADGHAGFAFTKLDAEGQPLPASAASWACVRDDVTGLIWEGKTDDGGLRDKDWTYTWYNPDPARNGGSVGVPDGTANCWNQARCDTDKFAADVNQAGLCGARDWRLPTRRELRSIVDYGRYNPAIDTTYFPDIGQSWWYWSSSPYAYDAAIAWIVGFGYGADGGASKNGAFHVRLVRGGQALPFDPSCVSSLSPLQREHTAAGGSGTAAVSATAGCAWTATSNAAWLHIQMGASGTGNGEVTYGVDANTLANGRLGTLTIGGQTFSVWQAGSNAVVGLASLGGVVRNGATGLPLGGATVQLGAAQTVSQAGSGSYSFAGVAAGDYSLTASKAGYGTVVRAVTLAPLTSAARDLELRAGAGSPTVTGITSKYDKRFYFLEGAGHEVDFTTQVDWAGRTPQAVRLTTDKHVYEVPAGSGQVVKRLDAGAEFGACGGLKAEALSPSGASGAVSADFGVMSNPLFFVPWWSRTEKGDEFAYKPSAGVDWDFFDSEEPPWPGIPVAVPLFGGRKFSLEYFPDVEVDLASDGTLEVRLEAGLDELYKDTWGREKNVKKLWKLFTQRRKDGGFDRRRLPKQYMAGVEIELFPYLQIDGRWSDARCDWNLDGAFVGLVAQAKAETTWQNVFLAGPVPIPWYFKASFGVDVQAELDVIALTETTPRLAGELTLNPEVRGTLGAGVDSFIGVEGWVSGAVTETFRFDGDPALDVADLTLGVGGRAYALMFEYDFGSLEWTCDVLTGDCTGPGLNAAAAARSVGIAETATAARLIPRAYLEAPDYGSFPAGAAPRARAAVAGAVAAPTQTAAVQQVVFPQSQANLSAAGDRLQAAWLYDEPSRLAINRSVAVFSEWQGDAWGPYAAIADDGTADFHPRLLTFADGATAAAWEDVKTALADTATFEGMVAALEIRVGVRNAQTGQWQTQRLTNNAYLDRSPRVAGVPGDLWVVWIENQGNNVRGTPASQNALKAVHWNGTVWGAAQTLASFGEGLVRYELAYNGTQGALAMNLDLDGDSGTVDDQELYAINYTGGAWGALQRLTNDAVVDDNPKLAFDGQGALRVVWLRGGSVVSAPLDAAANAREVYASEYSTNLADFQLAAAADGRMTVVWAQPSAFNSDLMAIFYDPQGDAWGEPRPLSADPDTEKYLTAAFGADGPAVLYNRTPVTEVVQRVQSQSGRQASMAVPQDGFTDLFMTRHTITSGVAVKEGSLGTFPTNPKPGDPANLQAVVVNTGDTALADVAVRAFLGDPQTGGAVIAQTTLAEPLAPWAERAISLPWTVPATDVPLEIFLVVDPDEVLDDANRADNVASRAMVLPDLAVSNGRWEWVGDTETLASVVARVVNQGSIPAGAGALTLREGAADGPVLATVPFGPLAVGQAVDLATTWDVSALPGPTYPVYLSLDEAGAVAEQDELNNGMLVVVGSLAEDADKDGMLNAWERDQGLDPLSPGDAGLDGDADGLTNLQEFQRGTDPRDSDSDDDKVPDGQDAFPLDPTEWLDTDGDGIGNNADPDDDNDGFPDTIDPAPVDAEVVPAAGIGIHRQSLVRFYFDADGSYHWSAGDAISGGFGLATDLPLIGDWNGDGIDEIGIYRPSNRRFYLDLDGSDSWTAGDVTSAAFGVAGDLPLAGDWNGDGVDEIGVYRPSTRRFYLDMDGSRSWTAGDISSAAFGIPGDMPLAGDWNGDGIDEIGIYRPSNRRFYLDLDGSDSWTAGDLTSAAFGIAGDLPLANDWNGDGVDEIGIYRAADRRFFLDMDGSDSWTAGDLMSAPFGVAGDLPVGGRW